MTDFPRVTCAKKFKGDGTRRLVLFNNDRSVYGIIACS